MLKSRTFLYSLIALSALIALIYGGFYLYDRFRLRTVVIATNEEGSQSYDMIFALAQAVQRVDERIKIQIVQTGGSTEIMQLLKNGKADFGTAQLDTELNVNVETVALLYPQVFQMIVRTNSDIQTPADLRGKKVATPSQSGGSYKSVIELLEYYGLSTEDVDVIAFEDGDLRDAAFLNGDVDAVFRATAISSDSIRALAQAGDIRFLQLEQFEAMRLQYPYLFQYTIPRGTYRAADPVIPNQDTSTVGVPTVLFANINSDPEVVKLVTQVLFEQRNEIIRTTTQAIWIESPVPYQSIVPAIHPGALSYYNRDVPNFFARYYNELSLLFTFGPILVSLYFTFLASFQARQKSAASQYNLELAKLLADLTYTKNERNVQYIERSLFESLNEVVEAMEDGKISPTDLQIYSLVWEKAMDAVRRRYDLLKKRTTKRKKKVVRS